MQILFRTLAVFILCTLALSSAAVAGGKNYTSYQVRGSFFGPVSTNNFGQVVGFAYNFSKDYYFDGALYASHAGEWHKLAGPNEAGIPAPPQMGSTRLWAFDPNDINDSSQIVGGGYGGAGVMITPVPISTKNGTTLTWYLDENNDGKNDLIKRILIDGYNDRGRATHINEDGTVFGTLYDEVNPDGTAGKVKRFYRWTVDKGAVIFDAPYPYMASIIDVNEAGEVIGVCMDGPWGRYNSYVGFYWSEKTGTIKVPIDLGSHTYVYDINNVGEVVGLVASETPGARFVFRWKPATGDFTALPQLEGSVGALSINDNGVVAGQNIGRATTWDAENNITFLGNGTYKSCSVNDYSNNDYALGYCYTTDNIKTAIAWIPDPLTGSHTVETIEPKKGASVGFATPLNNVNMVWATISNQKKNSLSMVRIDLN